MSLADMFRRHVLRQHWWEFPAGRRIRVDVMSPGELVATREVRATELRRVHGE